jgi:hypothetical protein
MAVLLGIFPKNSILINLGNSFLLADEGKFFTKKLGTF